MRKIGMFNKISLDGFFAGPNGELDWFGHDPELGDTARGADWADTLLLGRVTYEMFASFWSHAADNPNLPDDMRVMADEMNRMTKVVFSTTLQDVDWQNTRIVRGNLVETVKELKQEEGGAITILGSGSIVQQLTGTSLIDEYAIAVVPVVLGTGKPLFKDVNKFNFELMEARAVSSGSVLLRYKPAGSV